ncbi:MAG: hypothetical protein Q7R52_03720 [archaeon]|nr:hypothetical protein [archaeon]
MEKNNSKKFILEFFKDSKITDKNGVLTISEVSKEFEDFIGKKSPYKFVFDFNLHNKVEDSELIMQGSYFLLSIRDYLRNKGQTSLLKINIKPDLSDIKKLKLKNCKIIEIKQSNFEFLSEFSFLSVYQYLNEKKQSIRKILVSGKKVLEVDISKFKIQNGNKEEIPITDLNESYKLSKNKLDSQVIKETKSIKSHLKEKLDRELHRIKDHYFKQIKEKDEEVERCIEKIKLLKSKLRHTFYDRDIDILNRIIRESNERLDKLKKKSYKERLKIEEKFHITDEVEKHVLSIKNSLINITLLYYPVYTLLISSKGKRRSVIYDPVLEKII